MHFLASRSAVAAALCALALAIPVRFAAGVPAADRGVATRPGAATAHRASPVLPAPGGPASRAATPCVAGLAGVYPCQDVDLLAHLPLGTFTSPPPDDGNDCWGWTDPLTGIEYAIVGLSNGTAFVDLSDPVAPLYVGFLPTHSGEVIWRDIKTYADHAFIVSEAAGHGMQVFDLTQLRSVTAPPVTFGETAHYAGFGATHNIVINEATGFAYSVGGDCSGGLHMIDIRDPLNPTFAGCFSADGYTHDAQCVTYHGPDAEHRGHEICLNANEDTITIVDVTDKQNPVQLSRLSYPDVAYVHQGWLTGDHRFFLQDDELDELFFGNDTRTYVWDVTDLDNPGVVGIHAGSSTAIDHNQYTRGQLLYQSNYTSGMRILDLSSVAAGTIVETAYFDTDPSGDAVDFNGAWSVYPYFASGVVIINTIDAGLFVVAPTVDQSPLCDAGGPYVGAIGAPLQFDATGSSDPEGPIAGYTWDFGDGSTGAGAQPTHTYAAGGEHVVVLCATDAAGAQSCCGTTAAVQAAASIGSAAVPTSPLVALHQNQPNPFNPRTAIAFELAQAAMVELRIVDAGGRHVRTLLAGAVAAGGHSVEWDGRNSAGEPVESGVYLSVLEIDGHLVSRKMVLAK